MEISLIDEKLSLFPADLPTCISYLNLHCNCIKQLDRESLVPISQTLKTLDISSNLLTDTDGIELLVFLSSLNLACNRISVLTPTIALLTHLVRLDLSFNALSDVTPLQNFSTANHSLKILLLHGNRLQSVPHLIKVLKNNSTLRELVLKREEITNPLCQLDYRAQLFAVLTGLQILDGVDPEGVSVSPSVSLNLMPELDELLKLQSQVSAQPSPNSSSLESSLHMKDTPQIDRALKLYRENRLLTVDESNDSMESVSVAGQPDHSENQTRLQHIEELLVHILDKDLDTAQPEPIDRGRCLEFDPFAGQHSPPTCLQRPSQRVSKRRDSAQELTAPGMRVQGRSAAREECEVKQLVSELESERERRWKSEEASRRLVGFIRELQSKEGAVIRKQELAVAHGARLDKVITEQAGKLLDSEEHIHGLSEELASLRVASGDWRGKEVRYQDALKKIQIVYKQLKFELENKDSEFHQEFSLHQRKLESTQQELAIANISNERIKEQLQQLQALFVSQEQHNQSTAARMIPRDGEELKQLVLREQERCRVQVQTLSEKYQSRIDEGARQYRALEDEFRMALRIEADRYTDLEAKYNQTSDEFSQTHTQLNSVSQREQKATQLVCDLTRMVKEQKQKIQALTQSNDSMLCEFQARICSLQEELEESRLVASNYDKLSADQVQLLSQLTAERAIADGLRQERELWSQELAKQGAALARDQGRLEAQVECQRSELTQLARLLNEERDNLKIKSKIVDDQNETISDLRGAVKAGKEEQSLLEGKLREMERHVSEQANECLQLEMQYEELCSQRRELTERMEASDEENANIKEKYSYLKSQWNEKVEVISTIEKEMAQAKRNFTEREAQFLQEKEKMEQILSENKGYRERLEFEKKEALHEMSAEFNRKVSEVRAEAERRIAEAQEKEKEVEEEMRALLFGISQERKHMQLKFQKLTSTIQDIQNNF